MLKKLIIILSFCMALSGCGKKEPVDEVVKKPMVNYGETMPDDELPAEEVQVFETEYVWNGDDGIDAQFKSLSMDFVSAIFQESFENCRIERFVFSNAQQKDLFDEDVALDFDLEFVYRRFPENTSQSALGPEEAINMHMKVYAEKENGRFDYDSFRCYVTEIDGDMGKTWPVFEKIPEPNTLYGEIDFDDGKLELDRKIWVREKGGYTDNGYFIADADIEYRFNIDENCTVSYYKTADFVDGMNIEEFMRMDETDDRMYYVTVDEYRNAVTDIVETYRLY